MLSTTRLLKAGVAWTRRDLPRRTRSALSETATQPRETLGNETSNAGGNVAHDFSSLPSPRRLPVLGTTLSLLMAGSTPQLHRYVDARHAELGPVYRDSIGPVNAVFVADPLEMRRVFQNEGRYPVHLLPDAWMLYNELYGCKRGLFFMNGEEWLYFRRIFNRLMLRNEDHDNFQAPSALVAEQLLTRWKNQKQPILDNLESDLYRWSLDALVATLIGPEAYKIHSSNLNSALSNFANIVHNIFLESSKLSLISARLSRALHLPVWGRFERAVDRSLHGASDLILELLPMAREGNGLLQKIVDQGLELKDVVRIVTDLVIAAVDTTSYSTIWAMYLLAKHPEQQELVSKEAQELGSSSPLVRGMIREALRLYPVAPFITRILPEDCEIGGYNIPAGNLVVLSLYTSGRSSSNFPNPEKFMPERWLRDSKTSQYKSVTNPQASLPFAFGARSCIGRKLAETQMAEIISQLITGHRLELKNPEQEIQMVMRLVSIPSEKIQIRLIPR